MEKPVVSRREFIALSAASTAAVLSGCATNPVTGKSQLMFVSKAEEIEMDKKWSPHQFSADYGETQDNALNEYVRSVGGGLVPFAHRQNMPYNFRVLNAVYVNGYTFPAGSVALTRGLMLMMEKESDMAAVLGHELGHVCARHTGRQMTKSILISAGLALVSVCIDDEKHKYAWIAAGLGAIGANLLLCHYSRDDEREADRLGMEYMVKAGYNPKGMAEIMDGFIKLQKEKPGALDVLFATHPMSQDRYLSALDRAKILYSNMANAREDKERYMDKTSRLRAIKGAIEEMQKGGELMGKEKYAEAETHFANGLKAAPSDYAGLLLMAKCKLAQKQNGEAERYAEQAKAAYPAEPQALHVNGVAKVEGGKFEPALQEFVAYEQRLPGNPNTLYYKGFCCEKTGKKEQAIGEYKRYLKEDPEGEHAEYVRKRLIEWGHLEAATGS